MRSIPGTVQQQLSHISDKTDFYAVILFLLWPLMALISAFRNYRASWAKNIFWAFCAFYGFVFAIGAENANSDIVRYVARLQMLHSMNLSFAEGFHYFINNVEIDIVNLLLTLSLSFFTESQAVLTLVYGTVFGFFFSRNLWFIMERLEGKMLSLTIILLICFFLINPIWKLNGFRMWTAAHVFIYGLLPYLFNGNKKGLAISFASIFFHFSFIVPVILLFTYILIGNRVNVLFGFFFLTIFVSEINIEAFNSLVESYAPEVLQERTESYRSEYQVESYRSGEETESRNWYVDWYKRAFGWSIIGFLMLLYLTGRKFLSENVPYMNLFCFTLLFYAAANLLSSLPSGGRYLTVVHLAALSLIILYVQNVPHEKWMKRFTYIATPGLILFIIVSVRIALYTLSATSVIGNPVLGFFTIDENISLNDVMRMIL